jgi:hypothetical protein
MSEVQEQVTGYIVSAVPLDDEQARRRTSGAWDISVEWAGRGDRWAVRHMGKVYDIDGEPEYEHIPSERTDEFLARFRFDRETALAVARRVAPTIVVNGKTASEVVAWMAATA